MTSPAAAADLHSSAPWPPGRILVTAATYDERDSIDALIDRVLESRDDLQMLVIDDDSPDGTGQAALERAAGEPRLHVLVRRGRRGLGSAILEGFTLARAQGFDIAVNIDADLSHDPDDIPRLLAALEPVGGRAADVVIGSRRVPGGRTLGWPLSRHVVSRLVGWFTRWAVGVPVEDPSSGFRAVRLASFTATPQGFAPGYAFFEEMLAHVHGTGGRIVEVPITFVDRTHGRSKAGLAEVLAGGWRLIRLAASTRLGI